MRETVLDILLIGGMIASAFALYQIFDIIKTAIKIRREDKNV